MVASISSNSSSVSNWADAIFSKLDTKNQGYIEKTDLQDALSKVGGKDKAGGQSVNVDDTFSALDGDNDGKITKSELTDAMTRLSDQLNAQFDASRVGRGGGGAGQAPAGPPPGGQGGGTSGTSATDSSSSSSSSDYIAAADTDGNGSVSEAEKAAYEKKLANAQADDGGSGASDGTRHARHQKDPVRELAHAMHLLKAYAENSGSSNGSTASAGSTDGASASDTGNVSGNVSVSVSVEA